MNLILKRVVINQTAYSLTVLKFIHFAANLSKLDAWGFKRKEPITKKIFVNSAVNNKKLILSKLRR